MPLTPVDGMWSIASSLLIGTHLTTTRLESVLNLSCMPVVWLSMPRTPAFTFVVTVFGSRS